VTQEILHLDIGARNVLLDECLTAKVACSERSQKVQAGKLYLTDKLRQPLKWLAPETLLERICSKETDVWAFGVTIWEIMTNQEPYPGMSAEEACHTLLHEGTNLSLSSIRYPSLQKLLTSCWEINPDKRPTMRSIGGILKSAVLPEVIQFQGATPTASRFSRRPHFNDDNSEIVAKYRRGKERSLKLQNSDTFIQPNLTAQTTDTATNNANVKPVQNQIPTQYSTNPPVESVPASEPVKPMPTKGNYTEPVRSSVVSNATVAPSDKKRIDPKSSLEISSPWAGNDQWPISPAKVYCTLPNFSD